MSELRSNVGAQILNHVSPKYTTSKHFMETRDALLHFDYNDDEIRADKSNEETKGQSERLALSASELRYLREPYSILDWVKRDEAKWTW